MWNLFTENCMLSFSMLSSLTRKIIVQPWQHRLTWKISKAWQTCRWYALSNSGFCCNRFCGSGSRGDSGEVWSDRQLAQRQKSVWRASLKKTVINLLIMMLLIIKKTTMKLHLLKKKKLNKFPLFAVLVTVNAFRDRPQVPVDWGCCSRGWSSTGQVPLGSHDEELRHGGVSQLRCGSGVRGPGPHQHMSLETQDQLQLRPKVAATHHVFRAGESGGGQDWWHRAGPHVRGWAGGLYTVGGRSYHRSVLSRWA